MRASIPGRHVPWTDILGYNGSRKVAGRNRREIPCECLENPSPSHPGSLVVFVGPRRGRYPIGCAKEREPVSIERGNPVQTRRTDPPRDELEKDGFERGRCRYWAWPPVQRLPDPIRAARRPRWRPRIPPTCTLHRPLTCSLQLGCELLPNCPWK